MKFIKLPTRIALLSDIERSEITNEEVEWTDGFTILNIDEIEHIDSEPDGNSAITFKSGEAIKIFLTIDEIATLLDSK